MAKFNFIKTIKLDFIGDFWKDCYIKFNGLTFAELKEIQPKLDNLDVEKDLTETSKFMIELLKSKFVEGKGISEKNEIIDISKDDLEEFPVDILTKFITELVGTNPNA